MGLNLSPHVNYQPSNAVIHTNNYHIIGEVSGECSQRYVFGIGGMSKKSRESNAIQEMYKNAHLKPGQAIININVTYTQQIYFFAIVVEVNSIAHGTIIEFTDNENICITPDTIETELIAPKLSKTEISITPDSIIIAEIQHASYKTIGNPGLLRNFQTAQLKVTGSKAIPSYYNQFRKQFNYQIAHYGSFSLKETAQPLIAHLIITDVQDNDVTGIIRFITKDGKDIVAFYLGTGTIKFLAHSLAYRMQGVVH